MTDNQPQDYQLYQSTSTLGSLNAKIIKISQNNVIAILTTSGVCLMRSDTDWTESIDYRQYRKCIIANPKQTYGQYLQRVLKRNVNRLCSDEMQKLYLDHTLFPLNNSATYKGYRNFEWSHGRCLNDQPLFALLSMEHELWIYQPNDTGGYEPTINVSKLLMEGYPRTHKQKHELNFDSVKDLIYSTAIIKMCWTEFTRNNPADDSPTSQTKSPVKSSSDEAGPSRTSTKRSRDRSRISSDKRSSTDELNRLMPIVRHFSCLLIALSRNGILYFFKIDQTESTLNCSYLNEWRPEDLVVKNIFYFKNLLVLVFESGQVELIRFELNLQQANEQNFDFSQLIKQQIELWTEEDYIEVNDLLVYEQGATINVVFTKTDHIILTALEVVNQSGNRRKRTTSSNYSNSPKKSSSHSKMPNISVVPSIVINQNEQLQIKKCLVEEALFKISSSGLCQLHNGDLLISSTDGNHYRVKLTDDYKLKQTKFGFPGLASESYCPMSLAATSDGYLCCTISYICSYFDHLELRDSTRITVFTTLSRTEVFETIASLIEATEPLVFHDLYSLLECFKIYQLSNEKFGLALGGYRVPDNLEQLSDLNLKVLRFALICDHSCKQRSQNQVDPNIAKFTFDEDTKKVERTTNGDAVSETTNKSSERRTSQSAGQAVKVDSEDMVLIENGNCEINGEAASQTNGNREFNQKSKQKDADSVPYAELIRKIEDILSGRHFNALFKAKPEQTSRLSDEQRQSIGLISSYSSAAGKEPGSRQTKKTKKCKESNVNERCPICEQSIEPTNRYQASCSNGHQFARCCYSLLICDLSRADYKVCSLCKRLTFIFPMIWPSSNENSTHCLYCC